MAIELQDKASFDGSIADGADESVELVTAKSDYLQILIDDGSGGVPDTYDIELEFYLPDFDDWMTHSVQTSQTSSAVKVDVLAAQTRVTITNQSGASSTFRFIAQGFKLI